MATQNAFIETYRTERPRLLAWLKNKVGDEAEDLLQDVVVRAVKDGDALEPVRDLSSWLWRGVRNAAIDAWRRRGRRAKAGESDFGELEDVVDQAWASASDELEREELLEALSLAVETLPPEQREVILAQALGGETFAAMSARTGVPLDTLAARKRYALAKLRRLLAAYYTEE